MSAKERRGTGRNMRKMQRNAEQERQAARRDQARRVMPLIGPLLDAWEGTDLSFRSDLCDEYRSLHDALQNISKAVELN